MLVYQRVVFNKISSTFNIWILKRLKRTAGIVTSELKNMKITG